MSTRATYHFAGYGYVPPVTFYVHYDSYPKGAALYFWDMLNYENWRGGMSHAFFRSNDVAEITQGHLIHLDTEYRYNLTYSDQGAILVDCLEGYGDDWESIFSGKLSHFINKNSEYIEAISVTGEDFACDYRMKSYSDEIETSTWKKLKDIFDFQTAIKAARTSKDNAPDMNKIIRLLKERGLVSEEADYTDPVTKYLIDGLLEHNDENLKFLTEEVQRVQQERKSTQ